MSKNSIAMLMENKLQSALDTDELIVALEEFEGKQVAVNVVGGVGCLLIISDLNIDTVKHKKQCDVKLEFNSAEEKICDISLFEILKAYRDNCLDQIYIYLENGQIIQIYELD